MKNLETYAQQVWSAPTLDEKRRILIEMIDSFQHKTKTDEYKNVVATTNSKTRLDQLAANFMLRDTDKVVS